jgi:hypothetical protein
MTCVTAWLGIAWGIGLALAPAAPAPPGQAPAPATDTDKDYEICLSRPLTVGQEYRFSATGRISNRTTLKIAGQSLNPENQEFSVECEAAAKVLAVNAQGEATQLSLSQVKCVRTDGSEKKSLLPDGAVVVAEAKADQDVFTVNGAPPAQEAQAALDLVINLGKGKSSDDEVFGTRQRQKVGDRWPVNAEAAAKDIQKIAKVAKDDITGSVTLEKVVKVGDVDCLQIAGEMTVSNFAPPTPPDAPPANVTLRILFSGLVPVAPGLNRLQESQDLTATVVMKVKTSPDRPEGTVETVNRHQVTTKYDYGR